VLHGKALRRLFGRKIEELTGCGESGIISVINCTSGDVIRVIKSRMK
jgi:hypothetical protein